MLATRQEIESAWDGGFRAGVYFGAICTGVIAGVLCVAAKLMGA